MNVEVLVPKKALDALKLRLKLDGHADALQDRAKSWADAVVHAAAERFAELPPPRPSFRNRCHARWDDGRRVQACDHESAPGKMRCAEHLPDGGKLDHLGRPTKAAEGKKS